MVKIHFLDKRLHLIKSKLSRRAEIMMKVIDLKNLDHLIAFFVFLDTLFGENTFKWVYLFFMDKRHSKGSTS